MNAPSVLIVDDSLVVREMLHAVLTDAGIIVPVMACDGNEAVDLVAQHDPDLVLMDVHMPHCDGLAALKKMLSVSPRRILLMSGADSEELAGLGFAGIAGGALDVIAKPVGNAQNDQLISRIKLLAGIELNIKIRHLPTHKKSPQRIGISSSSAPLSPPLSATLSPSFSTSPPSILANGLILPRARRTWQPRVVFITSSTGGPATLVDVLAQLPADYPLPILLAQHISPGFDIHFSKWLNDELALNVLLAVAGTRIAAGNIYVAPHDYHLTLSTRLRLELHQGEKENHQRPSGCVLLRSGAKAIKDRGLGVVLTGMGHDGAQGLLAMREAGAYTIVQSGETAVVDGMPKTARQAGAAEQVAAPHEIGQLLLAVVNNLAK